MTKLQILVAGHGGQGILLLGDYIAYLAMTEGKRVAFTPSYGPETRGGKAKCYVVESDEEVDNPIAEQPDIELIMNRPSLEYLDCLKQNGLLIYNSSLIEDGIDRDDLRKLAVPATEIAAQLKFELPSDQKIDTKLFANSVMFGAYLETCDPKVSEGRVANVLEHFLGNKKPELISMNRLAIEKGRAYARDNPVSSNRSSLPSNCVPSWALA